MYLLLFNILVLMCMCFAEFCVYKNANNEYAYCAEDATNQTLDFVPRVTNNITTLNIYGQPVRQLVYNAFQNITSARTILNIELLFCQISYINVGAFLNLDNLSDLTLSFNEIRDVDSKTFRPVKHVKNIYMASNRIEILRKGLFEDLLHLEGVHLGYNIISSIEPGTFASTPSLQYVVLSNNQLQHLDTSFLDSTSTISSLYLHDNPWICDTNLTELFHFYIKQPGHVMLTYMPECVYKEQSGRYHWHELSSSYLEILEPANETIKLNEGATLTLVCKVYGFPNPDVKWQKDSTIIDSGSLTTCGDSNTYCLNYTVTVEHNASEYHCIARHTNVRKRAHVTVYLSHTEAVKSNIAIFFYVIVLGAILILSCLSAIIYFICKRGKANQVPNDNDSTEDSLVRSNLGAETRENPRNRQDNIEMIHQR